jgi:hypothetical protein
MKESSFSFILLLVLMGFAFAQEETAPYFPAEDEEEQQQPATIKMQEMESLAIAALRKEFPRLSGVFASAHSCRLPDYGPFISVTIQLPAYYFTKPVLQELDRRQRAAEEQARRVRTKLERAAQLITMRSKEADLVELIESSKKKKSEREELESQLVEVRKTIDSLESDEDEVLVGQESVIQLNEVDLNKMLYANYQQLVQRVSKAMRNSLAENAPRIGDLEPGERVTLNTYIRDNILGSSGKSILFSLSPQDIQAFNDGEMDLDTLRERVVVTIEPRE